jgi:hypothetical protein
MISDKYQNELLRIVSASAITTTEVIQSLWSGYGQILRVGLSGSPYDSVIVKLIAPPQESNHPRGWNTDVSHQRKLKSYRVEEEWYKNYNRVTESWRIPQFIGASIIGNTRLIVLEDLDAAGFHLRKQSVSLEEVNACLSWLANFHAAHLNEAPKGLWEVGTYWHLNTRPDELQVMKDGKLKQNAHQLDLKLNTCNFQTLVHGDAKLANFCFAENGAVAAVDFQYVGGGCGMKDVAYFIGSCLNETECEQYETELLAYYFSALKKALDGCDINPTELEKEWRQMYPIAWADFARFLAGWMPTHQKLHRYTAMMVEKALG